MSRVSLQSYTFWPWGLCSSLFSIQNKAFTWPGTVPSLEIEKLGEEGKSWGNLIAASHRQDKIWTGKRQAVFRRSLRGFFHLFCPWRPRAIIFHLLAHDRYHESKLKTDCVYWSLKAACTVIYSWECKVKENYTTQFKKRQIGNAPLHSELTAINIKSIPF